MSRRMSIKRHKIDPEAKMAAVLEGLRSEISVPDTCRDNLIEIVIISERQSQVGKNPRYPVKSSAKLLVHIRPNCGK